MAAKKKPKGKSKSNTVPKSAAQKGAEAALYAAQQVGVESTRARGRQAAKGAFGSRTIRAGGTSLQQYNLAKYKSDPFPGLGGNPNLGASSPGAGPGPSSSGGRPAGPKSGATSADGKARIKQQAKAKAENRRKDNMSGINNAEKMAAQAAAKAKAKAAAAAAAAKAKKKKQQKLTDSKGGVVKATGTKVVIS